MTETVKHTPGPWVYEETNSPRGWIISAKDGLYDVCIVRDGSRHDENPANARLIGASPDLLEACKLLVRAEEKARNGEFVQDADQLISVGRAAIAKAEGQP